MKVERQELIGAIRKKIYIVLSVHKHNFVPYIYFAKIGRAKKWIQFDIRKLAADLGAELPPIKDISGVWSRDHTQYLRLQVEAQMVADWCASNNARKAIKALGKKKKSEE